MRSVNVDPAAWDDFLFWLASDRRTARRVTRLIAEIQRTPFEGIGKPEPLKGDLTGYWSQGEWGTWLLCRWLSFSGGCDRRTPNRPTAPTLADTTQVPRVSRTDLFDLGVLDGVRVRKGRRPSPGPLEVPGGPWAIRGCECAKLPN